MSAEESCASDGIKVDDDIKAAELRDEIVFKQPESSSLGDCPICCLPLSLDLRKCTLMSCCCKFICRGCDYANKMREKKGRLDPKCLFCRHPIPDSEEEAIIINNYMKRAEANDPVAMLQMGYFRKKAGDHVGADEYYTKAAALGNVEAHYNLSLMYKHGHPDEKIRKTKLYHLEEAAIGGQVDARYDLAIYEATHQRFDRSIKHWIIAANMGCDKSLDKLKGNYANGHIVTKEEFALALRAHHAAVKATKSPQREEAEAVRKKMEAARAARRK